MSAFLWTLLYGVVGLFVYLLVKRAFPVDGEGHYSPPEQRVLLLALFWPATVVFAIAIALLAGGIFLWCKIEDAFYDLRS